MVKCFKSVKALKCCLYLSFYLRAGPAKLENLAESLGRNEFTLVPGKTEVRHKEVLVQFCQQLPEKTREMQLALRLL